MASADDAPDIPERTAPSPFDIPDSLRGPFFRELAERKRKGRDAKVLVTAKDGQTGVGKSNLCDFLGYVLDTSAAGFGEEKVTIEPQRFLELYNELPEGSAAIMEEGGQFDSRRAMANENVDATHKWQQARVRQIFAFINLPSPQDIDSRMERLADFWINVELRGRARVYKKRIHPTKRQLYYETLQTIEWPNMDRSSTFRAMDTMKDAMLSDEDADNNWVRENEVKERVNRAVKQARQDVRDEFLTALYKETDMSGNDIAKLSTVGVQGSRVRQIANDSS